MKITIAIAAIALTLASSQARAQERAGSAALGALSGALVLGPEGARLAKRHGAVTLDDRRALGESPADVRASLLESVGLPGDLDEALAAFDPATVPREPTVLEAAA